jgi:hypothetical protein
MFSWNSLLLKFRKEFESDEKLRQMSRIIKVKSEKKESIK